MSLYAYVEDNTIQKTRARPRWLDDSGKPLTDSHLRKLGWLPVDSTTNIPSIDQQTQEYHQRPHSEWSIENDKVIVTYNVVNLSISERRQLTIKRIRRQSLNVIKRGVLYNNTSWPVDEGMKQHIMALYEGIQIEDRLPQNKSTYYLRDINGNKVELTKTEIVELARAVFDFLDAVADYEDDLIEQAENSDTPEDIDITSGWPSG